MRQFWGLKKSKGESCSTKDEVSASKDVDTKLPDSWSQPKVVIVGGGIAGLSAAQRLVQYGLRDVTLLEATDKLVSYIGSKLLVITSYIEGVSDHWINGSTLKSAISSKPPKSHAGNPITTF